MVTVIVPVLPVRFVVLMLILVDGVLSMFAPTAAGDMTNEVDP
jgi:hypothetical protein